MSAEKEFTTSFCPNCNHVSYRDRNKGNMEKCESCGFASLVFIPSNRVFTESPEIALWYCIRKLKYKANLKEVVTNRITRDFRKYESSGYTQASLDDITEQTELVIMALSQAEEYYHHAKTADIAVTRSLPLRND